MINKEIKILMLTGQDEFSKIMYNGLKDHFNIVAIVNEKKVSLKIFIKKRIKNLGFLKVLGQIFFIIFNKMLFKKSKSRINYLKNIYNLNSDSIPKSKIVNVDSINDIQVINIINNYKPKIIIVNGTRIIKENILLSTDAIFLNSHLGITPKYRGVHGGYWALTENDNKNCGVTIHLIDKGIDTGSILYQDIIDINHNDNFNTYPYHQIAKAVPMMRKAIESIINNNLHIKKRDDLESRLWTHPTLYQYLKFKIFKNIK